MRVEKAFLIDVIPGMLIDGNRVNLSPGMNITAEIKTGGVGDGVSAESGPAGGE